MKDARKLYGKEAPVSIAYYLGEEFHTRLIIMIRGVLRMGKMKVKLMDRLLKVFIVVLVVWLWLGLFGLISLGPSINNYNNFEIINYNFGMHVLVFFIVYAISEIFLIYYRKSIWNYPYGITNFKTFMKDNLLIFLVAGLYGFLYFIAIYIIKNIGRWLAAGLNYLGVLLSKLFALIQDNVWIVFVGILIVGVIAAVVFLKYWLYKEFIERRK